MRAVIAAEPGGPEVLSVAEVPDPEPGRARCCSTSPRPAVNRADLLQRQGFYPPPPGASDVHRAWSAAAPSRRVGADVDRAGPSATRCARCSPAAGTPSRSPYRPDR